VQVVREQEYSALTCALSTARAPLKRQLKQRTQRVSKSSIQLQRPAEQISERDQSCSARRDDPHAVTIREPIRALRLQFFVLASLSTRHTYHPPRSHLKQKCGEKLVQWSAHSARWRRATTDGRQGSTAVSLAPTTTNPVQRRDPPCSNLPSRMQPTFSVRARFVAMPGPQRWPFISLRQSTPRAACSLHDSMPC